MESVLVNCSEIRSVCRPEDGVCDVGPHDHRDLRRNFLFDANFRQAGRVLSVYLILDISVGYDIRRDYPFCRAGRSGLGN